MKRRRYRRLTAVSESPEEFTAAVEDALRPVHEAVGEAPARLTELGVTGRTYFNAGKGLLIA